MNIRDALASFEELEFTDEQRALVEREIDRCGVDLETLDALAETSLDQGPTTRFTLIAAVAMYLNRLRAAGWTVEPPKVQH